jgi:lysylphosphatidylglycerol synthetase-like protein (DUF2156 family)
MWRAGRMRLRYYLIIALVVGAGHVALSFGIIAASEVRHFALHNPRFRGLRASDFKHLDAWCV